MKDVAKKVTEIINNNKRIFRKLEHIWRILTKPKNYLILGTIEEYKTFFYTPRIKIDNQECFFSETAEEALKEFIDTLQKINHIESFVSHGYIRSLVIKIIEETVEKRLKHNINPDKTQVINILTVLIGSKKDYEFIRSIEGLELKDMKSLKLGSSEIFVFDLDYQEKIKKYCEKTSSLDFYQQSIVPMINKYFLNKTCLRVNALGERGKASDIALSRMKLVVNALRFFLCLFIYKRVHQHMIQINLSSEIYKCGDESLCIGYESDEITVSYGGGRRPLQKFTVTSKFIEELQKKCFLDEVISLIVETDLSELEGAILTAIYWIGEAQNEFDYDVSFLKYWTALEAVTFNPGDISESLSKNTSILLAFGEYDFIKKEDIEETKKSLKRLYDKRSKVIHRGMREKVSPLDLSEICKYSTWTVLSLLNLRQKNYKKLEDIKNQTDRLYSVIAKQD